MKRPIVYNNVKKYRVLMDMTQQELADKALVHRQTIVSIENKSYAPSIEVAYAISIAVGKDIKEVFYIKEEGDVSK
ncbi:MULTISPECIES: helix-turn-helix transcriptional regulator [Cytobacillus]|uniref:helix-turn-helix transcriptional regulator n=1 Tax=Cytobacillus TaxID=2675230 RepID=UPI00135A7772|nr:MULTISPECIES: helix-turn-helix transcriptional regulator [Cytobacillus]KAF0817702.1 DNA-binding protein [Bacillus sp. ZZV12-4809]MCM3093738.1 helix-turn-helix transcriptional regulator [Cytobacillus sp. AMY 15.2]MCM3707898.1 helix-turn-helix transcriptional regulator [Cytobacillus firmus]MCS0824648.1 helix-turn-helix transcriptional regulator [Cytobacillus firmus]